MIIAVKTVAILKCKGFEKLLNPFLRHNTRREFLNSFCFG